MRSFITAQQPVASTSGRPWSAAAAQHVPSSLVSIVGGGRNNTKVTLLAPTAQTTTACSSAAAARRAAAAPWVCRASDGGADGTQPSSQSPPEASAPAPRIKRTLADLDALLGVQPDAPATPSSSSKAPAQASNPPASAAPSGNSDLDALRNTLAEARQNGSADPSTNKALREDMEVQFQRIIQKARKLADEQSKTGGQVEAEQAQLRQEFESLLQSISNSPATLDKEDVRRLKEAAFGPQTFFITETQQLAQSDRTGLLVRGNLRDERTKVYDHICKKVAELFGDKYAVIMVEDEEAMQDDANSAATGLELGTSASPKAFGGASTRSMELNTPRVAFQIIPAAQAVPPQPNGWKRAVALVAMLLFLGSALQLALAANITKLPRETLEWFANPANFESDQLPPGLEAWDPVPWFATAVPIFAAVLGGNLAHEIGHRVAAAMRGVRLGPTYFVPNFQIGSFGAITPFISMLKDRLQLWDVAAAGPLAGVLVSGALLFVGLAQSQPGQLPADALVPVPTPLFQGSLLLGGVARAFLGEGALRATEVPVSPLVIAGWCGLITQALQLLPVGSVDGGRMVQGAFGKGALSITSFFTYLGLGLGLLGSSLALPFGLYVIICQRTAEKYVADNVTPAGDARASATLAAIMFAILVLVPMAPELADQLGVGPARDSMFF